MAVRSSILLMDIGYWSDPSLPIAGIVPLVYVQDTEQSGQLFPATVSTQKQMVSSVCRFVPLLLTYQSLFTRGSYLSSSNQLLQVLDTRRLLPCFSFCSCLVSVPSTAPI